MKSNIKKILILLGFVFIAAFLIGNTPNSNNAISTAEETQIPVEIDPRKPKTSAYQTYNELWIDDYGGSGNGSWADIDAAYTWCTWTGSEYLLEDVTLTNPDGLGNTLYITDSEVPFIVKNCSISNAESNGNYANIMLINASNGMISDCIISGGFVGIFLDWVAAVDSGCTDNIIIQYLMKYFFSNNFFFFLNRHYSHLFDK